jgi:D-3-phosphoglycerate dehydrogenase
MKAPAHHIFVSTYPFAKMDQTPLDLLKASGIPYTLNPLHRRLTPQEIAEFAKDSTAIIASTEDLLPLVQSNKNLKIISRVGIGLDSVPLEKCEQKNIAVAYTPDAVTEAVAELTLGLMINCTRHITKAHLSTLQGGWQRYIGKSLEDSTVGIIGMGRIGKRVSTLLQAFRVKNILWNDTSINVQKQMESNRANNVAFAEKNTILEKCDIITLHIPMNAKNKSYLSKNEFHLMKKNAWLINTARGELIHEPDLVSALEDGLLQGAALDVFCTEPYAGPLTQMPQVLLTQHMGSCTEKGRRLMEFQAVENTLKLINNEKINDLVTKAHWP